MSLRGRLLSAFAYALLVVLVALEVPLALNLSRRVDAEVKAEAAGQAQVVAVSAAGRLDRGAELARLVGRSAREIGGRVIVVDARGRLLADSAGDGLSFSSYRSRPEIARAVAGQTAQGTRRSASLDEELLFTAVPVVSGGRPRGAVRMTQSVSAVRAEVRRSIAALAGVGAAALALGLGVAWLLAGSLSRPLRELAAAARRVSSGDLRARVSASGATEQREVAEAFNTMTERLAHSLAAQRELVANASHQLRTPLTGLRLRLEAAGLKSSDPAVEADLAAAEREAERLAALLTDLLELAGGEERPPGPPASLAEAARAGQERWGPRAEETGHVLRLLPGRDARALARLEDLAVAVDHLLENALNYSSPGTEVVLEWGVEGTHGHIAVLDRGPGISPEDRPRVFDRFYRGRRPAPSARGTGLGLSIVQAIATRAGGEARVEPRGGGGTRAQLVLPVDVASAPPEGVARLAAATGGSGRG